MHSNVSWGSSGFKRCALSSFCLAGLILLGAAIPATHASEILATAQITGVQIAENNWAYTLTLENTAASTSDIGMYWFGWQAGEADFLNSEPTSVVVPDGWTAVIDGGPPDDGYSIQFITTGPELAPGSSVTFTFDSADSTNVMASPATSYPLYATLTSQAYSARDAGGVQTLFLVQLVQAPSTNDLGQVAIQTSGSNVNLAWTPGTNVVLQQTSGLTPIKWVTVPGTLGTNTFTITNPLGTTPIFYRLAAQ